MNNYKLVGQCYGGRRSKWGNLWKCLMRFKKFSWSARSYFSEQRLAICSPTLFLLPKHRRRFHFPTKESRTQVKIYLILYLLSCYYSNCGQQATCIRSIWYQLNMHIQRDFCGDKAGDMPREIVSSLKPVAQPKEKPQ